MHLILRKLSLMMALLSLMTLATGCSNVAVEEKESLYSSGGFELYADSIVRDGTVYKALSDTCIGEVWSATSDTGRRSPRLITALKMADALFAKAVASPSGMSAEEIYLSLGLMRPEESMAALRRLASAPVDDNEDFPRSSLQPYWASAAWEVYCATGSKEWLREAYDYIIKMLSRQSALNSSPLCTELKCGIPWNITDPSVAYPPRMNDMSRFQSFSSSVNIARAHTLEIASRMAAELHLSAERELHALSENIGNTVNDRLWLPDLQRYGQYLYGDYFPIVSTVTDNEANLLAVMAEVATPEMSSAIVANLPSGELGVPHTYPYLVPSAPPVAWLQGLYGLAASTVRNSAAFLHAMAAVWSVTLDGDQSAVWPAMVIKGLFGIKPERDCLNFRPMVPDIFPGEKRIENLSYRGATFDIAIHGTGDRIVSFMLDSVSVTPYRVAADITGHHRIDITLSGNDLNAKPLRIMEPLALPATPDVKWPTPSDLRIINFDDRLHYEIYTDGVMTEAIKTDAYRVPDGCLVTDIVPTLERGVSGYSPASHIDAPEGSLITVKASSITPRRPPIHLIKDPATATNYIELAARHNTRITCYVNVAEEGDYFLTVGYTNGSTRCAVRTLGINGKDVGTLLFPSRRANDWVRVYPSTTAVVHLKVGVNKLWLTYVRGTILFNKLTLLKRS